MSGVSSIWERQAEFPEGCGVLLGTDYVNFITFFTTKKKFGERVVHALYHHPQDVCGLHGPWRRFFDVAIVTFDLLSMFSKVSCCFQTHHSTHKNNCDPSMSVLSSQNVRILAILQQLRNHHSEVLARDPINSFHVQLLPAFRFFFAFTTGKFMHIVYNIDFNNVGTIAL